MPNYKDGKIYKIYNDENDLVYYGSSVQPLYKRLYAHKQDAKQKYQCKSHNLDVDIEKCKIVLVENYSCNSKEELHARERFYIENNKCVNKSIPCRTKKEWQEDNKEEIAKKNKKRYEDNKEELKQYFKKRYEDNKEEINNKKKEKIHCECGSVINRGDLARHKKSMKHQNFI